jgi:hypothetical protein
MALNKEQQGTVNANIASTANFFYPSLVNFSAGEGLAGGGNLSSSRSFSLDINSLTENSSPTTSTDYLVYWNNGEGGHRKILFDDLPSSGGGGGGTWGSIIGTLSNQTDLQNALNDKADISTQLPSGGATNDVLVKASNTDYDTQWTTLIEGSTQSALARLFSVQGISDNSTALTANSRTIITIWNTANYAEPGITFNGTTVTIGPELDGKTLFFSCAIGGDSNNRAELNLYLVKNGSEDIAMTSNYTARDTDQNLGGTTMPMKDVVVADGDSFHFEYFLDPDGTVVPSIDDMWYITIVGEKDIITPTAIQGPQGPPGNMSWEGAWSAGTYLLDNIVTNEGAVYICTVASTTEEPSVLASDWDILMEAPTAAPRPVTHLISNTSTNIGGPTGSTTIIPWNNQLAHNSTYFTHDTSSNNSRITVVNTGRYEIKASLLADNTGGNRSSIAGRLRVNGVNTIERSTNIAYSRGLTFGNRLTPWVNTELELNAGDYIEFETVCVFSEQTDAVNLVSGESEFIIRYLD